MMKKFKAAIFFISEQIRPLAPKEKKSRNIVGALIQL